MTPFSRLALTGAAALAAAFAAQTALAQDAVCPLAYEQFEFAVPRTDMESCPPAVAAPAGTFCRAALMAETLTVFVFAEDADQCIVQTRVFEPDGFEIAFD